MRRLTATALSGCTLLEQYFLGPPASIWKSSREACALSSAAPYSGQMDTMAPGKPVLTRPGATGCYPGNRAATISIVPPG
ncbi:MAG TPA: hypothetical protein VGF67_32765 [Ktedonobacteraceae bacterium]